LLIGYRGYDRSGTAPQFPFGPGLGYPTWAFESVIAPSGNPAPGADLELAVTVRNTGSRAGKEVVQAYLAGPPGDQARPVRALAAFAVATAEPGQAAEVRLRVPARAFDRYDQATAAWTQIPGQFTVQIGRSSRDLRLTFMIPKDLTCWHP
jgi:beta-glucosidase